MNASVELRKLVEAIRILKWVYSGRRKTTLACMQYLRIEACMATNTVTLTAVSRDIDIVQVLVTALVTCSGVVGVRAASFEKMVGLIDANSVRMTSANGNLEVGEHGLLEIGLDAAEFPGFVEDETSVRELSWLSLARMIRSVRPAISKDDRCFLLNGICIFSEKKRGKKIWVAATDGKRLHLEWMPSGRRENFSLNIPDRVSVLLMRIPLDDVTVRMACTGHENGTQAPMLTLGWTFLKRGIDVRMQVHVTPGKYPDVFQVVPRDESGYTRVMCNAEALRSAVSDVQRVMLTSECAEDRELICIAVRTGHLRVCGMANDVDWRRDVPISDKSDVIMDMLPVMNGGFLVDATTWIHGDAELRLDDRAACVLRSGRSVHVWMPIRCSYPRTRANDA